MFSIGIGQMAIISMISHVAFIYITWMVIQSVNFELIIRKNHVAEARILIMFITIVIGTGVSRFVLEIIQWSQDLQYLL